MTHPSNISKEYLLRTVISKTTNTKEELLKILNQKPEFIVKGEIFYLQSNPDAMALLMKTLQTQYVLVKNIQETQIYRRIDPKN
ncbi:hypothetical protein [Nostoc sp. UHCC 0870]|uniref:hypothetical protein n=1 Tax=Nostoc sp. UHCC 0870 TaxID=2914041 RepID=UPI0030DD9BDC